ncbi:hypothetical protein ACQPZF_02320 [Actinosynnema sp. CS-041913]|uniref:hypothetical protein n=1 Tax=Actinosynnema sp. CS-041913 TaxID=3239917 RepID=UPI003D8DA1E7
MMLTTPAAAAPAAATPTAAAPTAVPARLSLVPSTAAVSGSNAPATTLAGLISGSSIVSEDGSLARAVGPR